MTLFLGAFFISQVSLTTLKDEFCREVSFAIFLRSQEFHYKVGNVPKDSLGPELKVNTGKELCAAFIQRYLPIRYCSIWTNTYNELPSSLSGGMLTMWITLLKGGQTRRQKTGRVHFLRNVFSEGFTSSRYWTKKSFRAIRTRARVLLGNVQILGAICQYLFRTGSLRVQKMPELLKNKSMLLDGQVIAQFCLWYIISNMTRKGQLISS